MPSTTSIRLWVPVPPTWTIAAVHDGNNTISITGDYAHLFPSGTVFNISGCTSDYAVLNGNQTSTGAVYGAGVTVITIAAYTLGGSSGSFAGTVSKTTFAISSVNDSTNTIVVAGNVAAQFYAGRPFLIGGATTDYSTLNATWVVTSSSYSAPNTTITTSDFTLAANSPAGSSGSRGSIVLYPMIDFKTPENSCFARLIPTWNKRPGSTFEDRSGNAMIVAPSDIEDIKRFARRFALEIDLLDSDIEQYVGYYLADFLYEYGMEHDSKFRVFVEQHGRRSETNYTKYRYYDGYLEDIPGFLFGDMGWTDQAPGAIVLGFDAVADGTFSTWNSPTSITARTRP